jgi:hypothetical protein
MVTKIFDLNAKRVFVAEFEELRADMSNRRALIFGVAG